MFISVEGVDRAGKDSFLLALDKKGLWENCNMMRGPAGCLTYDEIYNRKNSERVAEAYSVANAIKSTKHLIIFIYADAETIENRLLEEGVGAYASFAPKGWSIQDVIDLYRKNIYKLYGKDEVLELNSSTMTIEDEVNIAKTKIEEIRSQKLQLVENPIAKNVTSPNLGVYTYKEYMPFKRVFTKEDFSFNPDWAFDKSVDEPYYEMLYSSLKHKLYEYELKWINKRQIVYTSQDCISYVQILLSDNEMKFIVSQRSCDFKKHKLNDILFFFYFASHCTHLFKGEYNVVVDYTCAVPHEYTKVEPINTIEKC